MPDVVAAEAGEGEGGKKTGCGYTVPEPGTVCAFPAVSHAEPKLSKILLALGIVGAAYAVAIAFNVAYYGRRDERLVGLTERFEGAARRLRVPQEQVLPRHDL